jgi:hypothetical protein
MRFLKTDRTGDNEIIAPIELDDYFQAFKNVNALFENDNVFSMEAKDFRNGNKSLTLRDKKNKILYQLKTIE